MSYSVVKQPNGKYKLTKKKLPEVKEKSKDDMAMDAIKNGMKKQC